MKYDVITFALLQKLEFMSSQSPHSTVTLQICSNVHHMVKKTQIMKDIIQRSECKTVLFSLVVYVKTGCYLLSPQCFLI